MNSPILCLVVILIVIIIIIVIVGIANYSTNNTQCNNFKNGKNNKFQNGITTPPAVCTRPISTLAEMYIVVQAIILCQMQMEHAQLQ